ncbi:MAG: hypothetical protein JW822_00680 [Spirochaetales bacterium]|nr:hypothetical protein [Spirochaetales bacterium]
MKKFFKRIGKKLNAYFERLAESNNKLYGNKRLDCCDMNNKQSKITHQYTKEV